MNYLLFRKIIHAKDYLSIKQKIRASLNIVSLARPNESSRPENLNRWDIMCECIR